MVLLSQTEYAAHRGVTQQRISALISKGKIPEHCIKKVGKYKKIDSDAADTALAANLDRLYNRPKPTEKMRRGKSQVAASEQKSAIKKSGKKMVSLADAQERKANYDAFLKELEYKVKTGDLLPVDEVKQAMADMVLTARGKILAIKGSLAPLLKEFIEDQNNFGIAMDRVEGIIRDTLDDMASKKI